MTARFARMRKPPIEELRPDGLPDEFPVPNPDENDEPPKQI